MQLAQADWAQKQWLRHGFPYRVALVHGTVEVLTVVQPKQMAHLMTHHLKMIQYSMQKWYEKKGICGQGFLYMEII